MMPRIISVSTAPYDGHDIAASLDSLAACGVTHAEPAYIVGYTEPFDETAFTEAAAVRYAGWLAASGLSCYAVSSHIDLGRDDAVEVFRGRMAFARRLGARIINTNAAVRAHAAAFFANIVPLAAHAADLGLTIGLENPGDGRDNLIDTAADGRALLERLALPSVRLNYDPANTASHRLGAVDPARDAVLALPGCAHLHLKDVRRSAAGWHFTPLGDGDIDFPVLFAALAQYPDLPLAIELPLRLHRGPDAQPRRRPAPVPMAEIEAALCRSLDCFAASAAAERRKDDGRAT